MPARLSLHHVIRPYWSADPPYVPSLQGQHEGERGALAHLTLDPDPAPVHLDELLSEREPEPRALYLPGLVAAYLISTAFSSSPIMDLTGYRQRPTTRPTAAYAECDMVHSPHAILPSSIGDMVPLKAAKPQHPMLQRLTANWGGGGERVDRET